MVNNKSISVGFRIPEELYYEIEHYGRKNKPKGQWDYDKTATLLELIEKGLNLGNKESDNQVSKNERKELRDELFADMEKFLSYRLKAFKSEVLDIVRQNVKQSDEVPTQSLDIIEQSVKQDGVIESPVLKQIENEILYGFESLPLQEKRKKINILSCKFPTIKNRIKEVLSERKNKPTRFNYSALNSKECVIIYKEFTGDNHANGSK